MKLLLLLLLLLLLPLLLIAPLRYRKVVEAVVAVDRSTAMASPVWSLGTTGLHSVADPPQLMHLEWLASEHLALKMN